MRRLPITILAIAALAAPPAHADVDFIDQTLHVDLATDPSEVTINASVQVTVTADTSSLLLMETAVPLVSLEWDGTPLTMTDLGWYFRADLPSTVGAGTDGTLTAVLSGEASCPYTGGYVTCLRTADLTYLTPPWDAGAWYLMNVEGSDLDDHTGTIQILQPTGHNAAAMGVVPDVTDNGDGTSTWEFVWDRQVSSLAFIAGALEEVTATDGFPVRGLYQGTVYVRDLMQGMIDEATLMAPIFSDWWGAPPLEEIAYTTFSGSTPFAGTSIQGLIMLHDMIFTPTYEYIVKEVSHELAHVWWGMMSSASASREFGFFAESMAEYSMWRARGVLEGDEVRMSGSRMNAVWYMYGRPNPSLDTAVLSSLGTEIAIFAIYHKGSTCVRTLEEAAGTDGIDAGLRAMVDAGPDGATMTGFLAAIEAESGVDLSNYVDIWLRGRGFPVVTLTPEITETTGGYQVTITASGDDFPMQLPVSLLMADGTTITGTLSYDARTGTATIDADTYPAAVMVDPGWTAVRELHPALEGDVSLDGRIDGADLIEVALRYGGYMPSERRMDGKYDPLYDLDGSETIDDIDINTLISLAVE